jgi:hypothetical protein
MVLIILHWLLLPGNKTLLVDLRAMLASICFTSANTCGKQQTMGVVLTVSLAVPL